MIRARMKNFLSIRSFLLAATLCSVITAYAQFDPVTVDDPDGAALVDIAADLDLLSSDVDPSLAHLFRATGFLRRGVDDGLGGGGGGGRARNR